PFKDYKPGDVIEGNNAIRELLKKSNHKVQSQKTTGTWLKDNYGQYIEEMEKGTGSSATRWRVKHFARGGSVGGSGNRDTVPAMLTPGEFVIRKQAAQRIGYNKLQKMNDGVQRFATGGIVQKFAKGGTVQN